jgi:hypothetical protein
VSIHNSRRIGPATFRARTRTKRDVSVEGGSPVAAMVFWREDNDVVVRRWLRSILCDGGNIRSTTCQGNKDGIHLSNGSPKKGQRWRGNGAVTLR